MEPNLDGPKGEAIQVSLKVGGFSVVYGVSLKGSPRNDTFEILPNLNMH